MSETIYQSLYRLAEQQKLGMGASKDWAVELRDYSFGPELYSLALTMRDVETLHDDQILPTFFTPEACTLLKSLPNLYWFWSAVREVCASVADDDALVGVDVVQRAFYRLYNALARAHDLHKPLAELSSEEQLLRMASGIILIKVDADGKPVVVINPIFVPPPK